KGSGEKGVSTANQVSTTRLEVCTASVPMNVSAAIPSTPPTTTIFGDEDLTIAQTLINLRSEKAKVKGVAFRDVEEPPRLTRSTTTLQPLLTIDPKDKGKGVLMEEKPEKLKKVKRRNQGLTQIENDADLAQRIYEEELAEIDADHELAVRMTHKEKEKYTIEERARLLAEYFERRKKQLAAERAKAIRNKPPLRTQVRNKMITYLKHMGKYTHQQLNHKTLEELQKLYQKEQKWINDFVPMDFEKEEKKSVKPESKGKKGKRIKRVSDLLLKQKSSKKQKMMQEQEFVKSDEEESTNYEHEKEEKKSVKPESKGKKGKRIKRVSDSLLKQKSSKKQKMMQEQEFVKSDEEESTNYEHEKEELRMWLTVVSDKEEIVDPEILSTNFNMLVEKRYPLIKEMLEKMLNWKLEAKANSTMAFELLKFIKSQVEE
nr:hypothetical protein [Tanacetum cinerariifolium]GEZ07852.1 hypothetical protein [Tanacetum cinerariifolium]